MSEKESKQVTNNYHKVYTVADAYTNTKLIEASKNGYVTLAFGGRLKTPVLSKSILSTSSTPYKATSEGRTAGNALFQSYGLLTNRACKEFMRRVRNSPYKYDVRLCAMIHDAIYLQVRQDLDIVHWVNKNLTECMAWQKLPELEHDKVKIHADLSLFYPNWSKEVVLKPADTKEMIKERCSE